VGGHGHAPDASPAVKTRYPLYRRLGEPQGRSGQVRNISPPPGFYPRTVQPVRSRYPYWATRPTNFDCTLSISIWPHSWLYPRQNDSQYRSKSSTHRSNCLRFLLGGDKFQKIAHTTHHTPLRFKMLVVIKICTRKCLRVGWQAEIPGAVKRVESPTGSRCVKSDDWWSKL
jgi:hypothetical protein